MRVSGLLPPLLLLGLWGLRLPCGALLPFHAPTLTHTARNKFHLANNNFYYYLVLSFFCFWGQSLWTFFSFLLFPLLIVSCCTLPVRGAVCFPPNCSTRTPTDTLMTTALCASPAARMRRGRDERRAEGAVTCGRATRACGAEHTFFSLLFCFLCGEGWQTPAAPRTQPHPAAVFLRIFFASRVHFTRRQSLRCRPREHFSLS
ncbi:ATPase [Trypanosoma cruzi]|uniref:ATPase n=1 Tax=Trypanosoma cruzi TaxID=5693 RepID=A0A7J6Y3U0_TRYCR|nr:ATPase [Trypanosoma cruzi]